MYMYVSKMRENEGLALGYLATYIRLRRRYMVHEINLTSYYVDYIDYFW